MNLLIQSTDKLTFYNGVKVRVWEGVTEGGVRCFVFVHALAVADGQHQEFDRALKEQLPPGHVVDMRQIL